MPDGLRDRIAERIGSQPTASPEQARLLDDLARALESTAQTASAIRPEPSAREVEERDLDASVGMPQVLRSVPQGALRPRLPPHSEGREGSRLLRRISPIGLAAGIGGASVAALVGLSSLTALVFAPASEPGRHRSASAHDTASLAIPLIAPIAAPQASPEEAQLIDRSQAFIARGDIRGARAMLAQAASDGSNAARFALAETFDPNMLAAWGARDHVADVMLARTLYRQALEAGDDRAARRIEALTEE